MLLLELLLTAGVLLLTDELLTGVLLGFALTLLKLVWKAARLKIVLVEQGPQQAELRLMGTATFLKVPQLASTLAQIAPQTQLSVPLAQLQYIDHACMELLEDWGRAAEAQGGALLIDDQGLRRRLEGRCRHALQGTAPTTPAVL